MAGNSGKRKGKNLRGSGLPPQPSTPMQGGFDGPSSPPPTAGQRGPNPFALGLGFDPAKAAPKKESVITNTRVELPQTAYKLDGGTSGTPQAQRRLELSTVSYEHPPRVWKLPSIRFLHPVTSNPSQRSCLLGRGTYS
ncbi:hypothetical protein BP5796_07356 [Coleophoma crateriformis]|uniref:Uncharacterized protein n=1 Tax=Coleophoma crateriformis TaxID=565419 RepID=A0A3D8RJ48_9HELO|nr:hypothetical protein BP5796_07356 [Coleophoma crateriformis]